MSNIGITEGMGKKIVEALKKQTEVSTTEETTSAITMNMGDTEPQIEFVEPQITPEETFVETPTTNMYEMPQQQETFIPQAASFNTMQSQTFTQQIPNVQPTGFTAATINSADADFDMPTNVAVLKQLITQLPTGVTKQTGAQIIKQTMEALGISMKSVLQEAQQVQESLNNSSRECQANIIEYKRQIALLEKQTQTYQKQYAVLNDIISLFIQTNNY